MHEVPLTQRPLAALVRLLAPDQAASFTAAMARARRELSGRVVWNISSTATGGGVAEMLQTLLGYFRDAGVQTRWLVIDADERFFTITKRLHNAIHGLPADPPLGAGDHRHYQQVLDRNRGALLEAVGPDDLVLLNDPQPAGLAGPLHRAGVPVAWRSHIGRDTPNEVSTAAWDFLRPYIEQADAFVFSRRQYAPGWIDPDRLWVIPPSIDPLSAKNQPIAPADCVRILTLAGLLNDALTPDKRLVVQVSRWDRLKDMPGVMEGFRRADLPGDVHLVLAGPAVAGVTDDPEGAQVLAECQADRDRLPAAIRDRVWLASIPTDDVERNATIVNALQRHATVVAQKSLAEGFGLTVAEAMWKAKPVVASAVGGIQDQITAERDGLLVADPCDLDAFARDLRRLLTDPGLAHRLGQAAHDRVCRRYLDDRQLAQLARLFEAMTAAAPGRPAAPLDRARP
jgi:trehalose synthase